MSNEEIKKLDLKNGKVYKVKWKYGGREFEDTMTFKGHRDYRYYFKDNGGDWLLTNPKKLLSIQKQ